MINFSSSLTFTDLFGRLSRKVFAQNPENFEQDENEIQTIHPNREQLTRRYALIPEQPSVQQEQDVAEGCSDNVYIVPHLQISPNDSHLFNRAISSGGGLLAELQRATIATQAFYADANEQSRNRSPWILKRLYEWSHRAKRREIIKHVQSALEISNDPEFDDEELEKLLPVSWDEMFVGVENLELIDKKRLQAVWELFHSELIFLHKQLLVLRNVYKEPLKKCQVEGCLLTVEPDLLFGNLDQICRISRSFCKSFLKLMKEVHEEGECADYNTTDLVVRLFERFSKGPSTISAYQAYCINYKATMEYLGTLREKEERFTEFERICLSDPRCERLQLEDLLIAPLQRITRLPILLREIHKYTQNVDDKARIEKVIENMNESLRSIDDSVQWLHNFERLQQLQNSVVWPPIMELEPRTYIPDFLRVALSRQFCEHLLAHPRRKLIHEGHLELVENGRTCDCYAFLFNDMFVLTKIKKYTRIKKGTTQLTKSEHYVVQKQPVPLDSCVFCDADSNDSATSMSLKYAFVIIHLTRYYQVVSMFTLQAANKRDKELWIEKFQESIENYESIQLKDMLKCTPLYSSLSLRRCSSSRLMRSSASNTPNPTTEQPTCSGRATDKQSDEQPEKQSDKQSDRDKQMEKEADKQEDKQPEKNKQMGIQSEMQSDKQSVNDEHVEERPDKQLDKQSGTDKQMEEPDKNPNKQSNKDEQMIHTGEQQDKQPEKNEEVEKQTDEQLDKQLKIDNYKDKQTDRESDKQSNEKKQADKEPDKQSDKNKQTEKQLSSQRDKRPEKDKQMEKEQEKQSDKKLEKQLSNQIDKQEDERNDQQQQNPESIMLISAAETAPSTTSSSINKKHEAKTEGENDT